MAKILSILLAVLVAQADARPWMGWDYADDVNAPLPDEPTLRRDRDWDIWGPGNYIAPANGWRSRGISRFDQNGILTADLGLTEAGARAALYLPPDKFLVTGWYDNGTAGGWIARMWLDGTFDTGFSGDGIQTLSTGGSDVLLHAITTDSVGRYIVAGKRGVTGSADWDFLVARYTTSGALDATFNGSGIQTVRYDSSQIARAVGVDSNDRIIVGGYVETGQLYNIDFMLARLNTNGSLDNTFDGDGIAVTEVDQYGNDMIFALRVLSNDKIAVVGSSRDSTRPNDVADYTAARYNTDGSLDPTFDSDGISVQAGTNHDVAWAMTIDSMGRIVSCGRTLRTATTFQTQFKSYNTDGSIAVNVAAQIRNRSICRAIEVDEGGRWVMAGRSFQAGDWDFITARITTDPAFDTSFATNGWRATELGAGEEDEAFAMVYHENKFIAFGRVDLDTAAPVNHGLAILRMNSNGTEAGAGDLDFWWHGTGVVEVDFNGDVDDAFAMMTDSQGRYVLGGYSQNGNAATRDFAVARFLADGSSDTGFAGTGSVLTDFPTNDHDQANDMAIDSSDRIYLAGFTENGAAATRDFAVVRYLSNGAIDAANWGTNGFVSVGFAASRDEGYGIELGTDGRIYVGGWVQNGGALTRDFGVVRLLTDGTVDASYGTGGWATADFGGEDWGLVTAISSNNKVLVGGWAEIGGTTEAERRMAIARWNANGTLDTSWGGTGMVTLEILSDQFEQVTALRVTSDGNVLVGGHGANGSENYLILARYLSNGTLDPNFGTTAPGYTTAFHTDGFNEAVYSINYNRAGKLLIVGSSSSPGMIARFFTNGAIDTFGAAVGYARPNGAAGDFLQNVVVQSDGRLVIGGRVNNNFGLYRVWP